MLNQASGDREILARKLKISLPQLRYVTNSNEGEGLLFFGNTIVPEVPDIDFVAATIACMGGPKEMERTRRIIAQACPAIDLVSPVPNWFDVLPKGVSKVCGHRHEPYL